VNTELDWRDFVDLGPSKERRPKTRCLKCGKFCNQWWPSDSLAILSLCCHADTVMS
jgi:hypothetical protein